MNKANCYNLGKITKTQGIKGNVYAYFDVDNPLQYQEMESVFVELNNALIPFFIDFFQYKKGGQILLKFEGIDSEEQAKEIVNCDLYLPEEILPELTDKQFYYHEIAGYQVIDTEKGNIGVVAKVLEYTNNPMLEIDFDGVEILLPIKDQFIEKVNRTDKTLTVICPPGLVDMYVSNEKVDDTDC